MRNWFIKVKTPDGQTFCCDCSEADAARVIAAAYDHFGVCGVTARPL